MLRFLSGCLTDTLKCLKCVWNLLTDSHFPAVLPLRLRTPRGQRVNLFRSLSCSTCSLLVGTWQVWSYYYFPYSDFYNVHGSSCSFSPLCHNLGSCVPICLALVVASSVFTHFCLLVLNFYRYLILFAYSAAHISTWSTRMSMHKSLKCLSLIFFHLKMEITRCCTIL